MLISELTRQKGVSMPACWHFLELQGTAGGERGMLIAEPTSLDPHKI